MLYSPLSYGDNLHYEKFADGSVKCIEDEIPFELPDGWAWSRLGAVAEAIGDGDHQPPPQTSFGVPFLVISNVSGGRLSFENTRFVSKEYFSQLPETRKPRNGDLLFTVTGSYGIPVLIDSDDKFCFQRHIAIVRPCTISNRYLYVILGSSYVKSICDAKATGTAQKTVGLATLRELLIPVAELHMLDFDLDEFADASAGGSQIPNHEVPLHVTVLLELLFQKVVIGIADHILQKVLLLYLHSFEPQTILVQEFQILVHCLDTQVDGLGLEEFHQIPFVGQQVFLVDLIVVGMIKIDRPEIGMDGVFRKIALS